MAEFLRKWWKPVTAALLLAVSIHLFLRPPASVAAGDPVRGAVSALLSPAGSAAASVRSAVSGAWYRYVALVGVSDENERLLRENRELRGRLDQSREALLENRRLKELLKFSSASGEVRTAGARVTGHDASPWFQALYIDAGTEAGVEAGMAVVTPSGGVGRIHSSWRNGSEVLLATDGRFAADVIVERSRVRAVAEGAGGSSCRLKYVPPAADVVLGDRVLFSGFDGSMPKGTLLGTVDSVERPKEGLFQRVRVRCAVPVRSVEELLVVLSRPSIPFRAAP
jgi:rod shape-determining protein MreC